MSLVSAITDLAVSIAGAIKDSRKRSNHTGSQQVNTISDFVNGVATYVYENTAPYFYAGSFVLDLPFQTRSFEYLLPFPGMLPNYTVHTWFSGTTDTDDNDLTMLEGASIVGIVQTEAILFVFNSQHYESGSVKINYRLTY